MKKIILLSLMAICFGQMIASILWIAVDPVATFANFFLHPIMGGTLGFLFLFAAKEAAGEERKKHRNISGLDAFRVTRTRPR